MTGPENYCEAEQVITEYEVIVEQGGDPGDMLQVAQIRATLALAAATAQGALAGSTPDGLEGMSQRDMDAWNEVAGTPAAVTPERPTLPRGLVRQIRAAANANIGSDSYDMPARAVRDFARDLETWIPEDYEAGENR